jgi:hypothetical protein
MSKRQRVPLIKKSRALYWGSDHELRVACTISKRYIRRPTTPYWYAYHPQWREFLAGGTSGHLVFGCMDLSVAYAIPSDVVHGVLDDLNATETDRGMCWHLHIVQNSSGEPELLVPKRSDNLPLSAFSFDVV